MSPTTIVRDSIRPPLSRKLIFLRDGNCYPCFQCESTYHRAGEAYFWFIRSKDSLKVRARKTCHQNTKREGADLPQDQRPCLYLSSPMENLRWPHLKEGQEGRGCSALTKHCRGCNKYIAKICSGSLNVGRTPYICIISPKL